MSSSTSTSTELSEDSCRVVANRYVIGDEIGRGTFCAVHKAWDKRENVHVAIKLEKKNSQKPELQRESELYKTLENLPGIPRMHGLEECGDSYAMIIDLLGPSIEALHRDCGGKFGIKTVLLFAIEAIALLERVHMRGIVYRDIKPQNFLTAGTGAANADNVQVFYLVDFGSAGCYWNKETNEHIPFAEGGIRIGTPRYMSINAHMSREQSRRDDLEALGYMLFYLLKGELPWMKQQAMDRKEKNEKILAIKRSCDIVQLGENYPKEFTDFLIYAKSLDFEANPDYKYVTGLFMTAIHRLNIQQDNVFDWNEAEDKEQRQVAGSEQKTGIVDSAYVDMEVV